MALTMLGATNLDQGVSLRSGGGHDAGADDTNNSNNIINYTVKMSWAFYEAHCTMTAPIASLGLLAS